jgi:Tetracyclin repressor-like, C-terminal domain
LQPAMQTAELREDIDIDVALDLIYGPLLFRLLLGHAPLDQAFVPPSFDHVLQGLVKSSAQVLPI